MKDTLINYRSITRAMHPGLIKVLLTIILATASLPAFSILVVSGSSIMDNSDAGFSTVGNWSSSSGVTGYYGSDYHYSGKGDGSSKAIWRFGIASSGNYNVKARWAANPGRATNAPYTIYNNGIFVAKVTKNQQINGGQFNPLGSYQLTAGTLEVVLNNKASGYVVADALQVTSSGTTSGGTTSGGTTSGGTTSSGTTSGGTTSSASIDNSDAGFSTAGNWPSSTGATGYYGSNYQYSGKGNGSSKATWRFGIASSGNYNVKARWTSNPGRATNAPYTLYNNGIFVAKVTKNQQINGGQFNPLGSYQLKAGTLEVVLDNKASGYVVADAVQVTSGGTSSGGTTSTSTTSGSTTSGSTTVSGTSDPVQSGKLTLRWTAPVTRTDGTPLSLADIDGYRVHYGQSAGNYTHHFTLADGTAQTVILTDLPVGTYHLVMTTYDVDGRESGYSSVVSKTVQ